MKKELRQICCPLCGSEKSKIIFTHARLANIKRTYASKESIKQFMTNLNTALCTNCGLLYRKPLMGDEELRHYYGSSYVETYKQKSNKQNKNDNEPYSARLLQRKKKYMINFNFLARNVIDFKAKRILDVGCGEGWFLALLKEDAALYRLGIEPSKQRCTDIARIQEFDFEVLNGCVRDFSPERLGKFGIITMIGVLEHLSNPIADLEVIRSFMVDSSYLYIYTHNETPNLIIDMNKRISLVHQLYFTPKKIKILFKKVGFRIIDLKKRNTNMHILLQKCEPIVDFQYKINRLQHALLKLRYTVNKNIPSRYYSITSWFYRKYIGVLYRSNLTKIY